MAKRKKTTSKTRASSTRVRGGRSGVQNTSVARGIGRFGLPLLISGVLLTVLSVLGVTFYRNATGSEFFHIRSVEVRGVDHTSADDVRRLVNVEVEKSGVWNADLPDLRSKIERFPYVKAASVTRVLPATMRVDITERIPAAIVHLSAGNYVVDADGTLLEKAAAGDQSFPFVLYGWDESKTDKAAPENNARIKTYRKMLDEWRQFDLSSRVRQVDLTNLREPVATVEDSGRAISVVLAKENLGKSLKTAIEAIGGKGARVKSVNSEGVSPIITYLDF